LSALSVPLALAAAFCNAFNVVTQHVASTAAPARDKGWHLARYLIGNPLWLLGLVAMVGAFSLQALALYHGQLSIVQPILVTELVFSLVLRRVWFRQILSLPAWVSASVTCLGLAVFVVMSEPQGGHLLPTPGAWVSATATMGAITVVLTMLASRGSPGRRAALYASATGIAWAAMATFIKSTTDDLAMRGISGTLRHWPVYALVAAGVAGSLLSQAALHYGPLSVSQPLMVIVDPFVSVILGIWIFGEHFTNDPAKIAAGCLAFVVMVGGVVAMWRTASPRVPG
jgi:drug/metabolite transporter (DMT)-like permease